MAKSPFTQLQSEYYTLLNGQITYDGNSVPVYEEPPVSPSYPYIQFIDVTETDDSTKSSFQSEVTFSMSIVDRFQGNFGSKAGIFSVWNDMLQIIRTRPSSAFSLTDFNVISTIVDNAIPITERTDTYTYKRLEVRLRHQIEEK